MGEYIGYDFYKELKTGMCLGINHYHSIIASMPICTEDNVKEIFAILKDYNVEYQRKVITDLMQINQIHYDFENWIIIRNF